MHYGCPNLKHHFTPLFRVRRITIVRERKRREKRVARKRGAARALPKKGDKRVGWGGVW